MKNSKSFKLCINMAMSIDGHVIQPNGKWNLGSKNDKLRMDALREWADALVVSRTSVQADNPNLYIRSKPKSKKQPRPVVILYHMQKKLNPNLRMFSLPHPDGEFWIPKGNEFCLDTRFYLPKSLQNSCRWQTFLYGSVEEIINSLVTRKYTKILLEGGPSLNAIFLHANLIDEIYITIVPVLIGGTRNDRLIQGNEVPFLKNYQLKSCETVGSEIFLRYRQVKKKS